MRLGMFEVQSDKLIHSLVAHAKELQQKLVTRMLQDHQQVNMKSVGLFFIHSIHSVQYGKTQN